MVSIMRIALPAAMLASFAFAACTSEGIYVKVAAQTQSLAHRAGLDPRLLMLASPPACAILPAAAPSAPGLAPLVSQTLDRALHEFNAAETVLSAGQSATRLNAAGAAADWQGLAAAYVASGVMDRERLGKVGKALGVRHVVMPMLATMTSQHSERFDLFGFTIDRTFWITIDTSLQVWDVETGELEWQSTGTCTAATEAAIATRGSLVGSLETLWKEMLTDMFELRSQSALREYLPAPSEVKVTRVKSTTKPSPSAAPQPAAPTAPAAPH
jgi:hypothetical protein